MKKNNNHKQSSPGHGTLCQLRDGMQNRYYEAHYRIGRCDRFDAYRSREARAAEREF